MTEPNRRTCLATVTAVVGARFTLDRALFAPRSKACRHPQYADEGTLWWDGEKRRLASVQDRGGHVWYTLRGTVPVVGAELQCQLNQEVRERTSRAHTAMHLLITGLQQVGAPPMAADPEVKGDGHFRITLAWPPATLLDDATKWANAAVAQDIVIHRNYVEKELVENRIPPQSFQPPDPVPGPDVLPLVGIGDDCVMPCDGTHVDRTGRLGRIRIRHARQGKGGFVVVGQVQ